MILSDFHSTQEKLFYIECMICCFEFLHDRNLAYRDIIKHSNTTDDQTCEENTFHIQWFVDKLYEKSGIITSESCKFRDLRIGNSQNHTDDECDDRAN